MSDEEEKMLGRIREIVREDARYPFEAYIFLYQALDYTTQKVVGERRHVSGRELSDGVRRLAIEAFGPLALMVFKQWGVRRTEDLGEIVWNLVQRDLMGKTDDDKREDFADGFAFEDAFDPERLTRELDLHDLAPPARLKLSELPRAARFTGKATEA